jgi:leader peptidase (prepilin peptidase)/N-methyltransferase
MQPLYPSDFSGRALDAYSSVFGALPVAVQYVFVILLGLVIGSFLSVVVHRLPVMLERAWRAEVNPDDAAPASRYNLAVPRSACPQCGHVLRAWENIPVVSYLLLRGRCSACGTRISARYPLTELSTALLAVVSLYAFGPTLMALAAFGLCATLLATSLIDFDTKYLPDSLTLPLLWAGLIVNIGEGGFVPLREAVVGAIAGYVFLWCVYWQAGAGCRRHGIRRLQAARGDWCVARLAGAAAGRAVLGTGGRDCRTGGDDGRSDALRGTVAIRAISRGGWRNYVVFRYTVLCPVRLSFQPTFEPGGGGGCSALA